MFKQSRNKRWGTVTGRPGRQQGAVTMFSAILILILLTEMLIYAVQVGVFEQRKSSNEMRQKQAFHAAETGIQHAQEYLLANTLDLTFNGTDGWLSDEASGRWVRCPALTGKGDHPCYGEPIEALRNDSYFYSVDGANPSLIPILTDDVLPDSTETVTVQALLCLLDLERTAVPPVQGCLDKNDSNLESIYFVITLLGRGQAECDVNGDCAAEALVAQKLGSFGPLTGSGGPGVPLTSRSTFPPGGTAEIVPNPNGGGPGVPISSWLNSNDCGSGVPVDPTGGSWTTCERHEWYGIDRMPGDFACPTATCSCGSDERRLSYSDGNTDEFGIDIVIDPLFPCDLFYYTFNVPRLDYLDVKHGPGVQVITDCDILGPESRGIIWVDSSVGTCTINANTRVGSPEQPVFLISAANLTRLNGGAEIFGVLYVTDVERGNGEFQSTGTNTIYGAAIIDGALGSFNGTFQIVYIEDLIDRATKSGSLGKMYGGWTDFHQSWQ